ncbi:Pentatricopeptide repeat-containing protein [Vitis vinifera]|uniref:Pentatricopeptide repeat-containing protein n=1 Tax=Vitis vinifera TaxID=29760 RepID=A0A438BP60_VITVI|nr:Pentatricopeptide repeat-containing protein [Vitis vinifera]
MPDRNIVSWTALVSGYAQYGRSDECFRVFRDMLIWHRPTEFAFASVISACGGDGDCGRQVHALALKTSFDSCVYVGNALIMMYCRSCGGADEAWSVSKAMGFRNLVSWNSMIARFQATLVSMFLACVEWVMVLNVVFALAYYKNWDLLGIGWLSRCCFLDGIIAVFAEWDPEEALLLFLQFLQEYLASDRHMFSIVLKACVGLATEQHASIVQSYVLKLDLRMTLCFANALIHAYARRGSVALSKQAFDKMGSPDTVSWYSMLKAYAMNGQGKEALQLFSRMDAQPDGATFVAILSACSHAGMVGEGTKIFETMSNNHGIVPQLDHYACMVDILGRAGQISEAKDLIGKMPMKPDSVVWIALLGGCRKHGETKLAKLAAVN